MGIYNPARAGTYTLNSSIGAADTTLTLTSFADPVTNVPITMSTLNTTIAYATIAPKTSQSEIISFTGITQNSDGTATITGLTRGLQFQYPFTGSASYQLPHSGQSIFILSDAPQVFQEYVPINDNVTINGLVTFAQPPIGINPGGQPNASPTVLGVVQEATTLQVNSGCNTGSTGGVLFASPADLAASNYGLNLPTSNQKAALVGDSGITTGSPNSANTYVTQQGFQNEAEVFGTTTGCSTTNAYALSLSPALTAYQDGQKFVFKASFATTGSPNTATLNVNSLGAGNLIKNGSPGQILVANDILNGQIVEVVRGSPNFQMISQLGNAGGLGLYACGASSHSTASGAQNIAHGLGVIPKFLRISWMHGGGVGAAIPEGIYTGMGSYDGTHVAQVYQYLDGGNNTQQGTDTTNIITVNTGGTNNGHTAIPTFNSTNIILTWTITNTPTTTNFTWEVFA